MDPAYDQRVLRTASALLFFLLIWLTGIAAATNDKAVPVKPGPQDKCGVCGMFVGEHPAWIAEIVFKDNSYAVFDGAKCMLKYYFDVAKYNSSKTKADIAELFVTEYYTTQLMPVQEVHFILGSDVLGPMGHEFVPVRGADAAQGFMKDHKGKTMLRFGEITPQHIPGKMVP